jgi:hypothetical protein
VNAGRSFNTPDWPNRNAELRSVFVPEFVTWGDGRERFPNSAKTDS